MKCWQKFLSILEALGRLLLLSLSTEGRDWAKPPAGSQISESLAVRFSCLYLSKTRIVYLLNMKQSIENHSVFGREDSSRPPDEQL